MEDVDVDADADNDNAEADPSTPLSPLSNKVISLESSVKTMKETIGFNTDRLNNLIETM